MIIKADVHDQKIYDAIKALIAIDKGHIELWQRRFIRDIKQREQQEIKKEKKLRCKYGEIQSARNSKQATKNM